MQTYRQGDVLLRRVEALPAASQRSGPINGRIVLAYGEVTGHAHAISEKQADLFIDGSRRFLEVCYKADLKHEEHATIALPKGVYEVIQQREYTPAGLRNVAD